MVKERKQCYVPAVSLNSNKHIPFEFSDDIRKKSTKDKDLEEKVEEDEYFTKV